MNTKSVASALAKSKPTKNPAPTQARKTYTSVAPGPAPFDILQARRFELVDETGRIRARLGFTDDGDPTLILCDDDGQQLRIRAELRLDAEGPCVVLSDKRGVRRLTLSVKKNGSVGCLINGSNGTPRLCIGSISGTGLGVIAFRDGKHGVNMLDSYPTTAELARYLCYLGNQGRLKDLRFAARLGGLNSRKVNDLLRDAKRQKPTAKATRAGRVKGGQHESGEAHREGFRRESPQRPKAQESHRSPAGRD